MTSQLPFGETRLSQEDELLAQKIASAVNDEDGSLFLQRDVTDCKQFQSVEVEMLKGIRLKKDLPRERAVSDDEVTANNERKAQGLCKFMLDDSSDSDAQSFKGIASSQEITSFEKQ